MNKTEQRVLHLAGSSPVIVTVTHWFLSWYMVGHTPRGEPVYTPVWKARLAELKDRFFTEKELQRVL